MRLNPHVILGWSWAAFRRSSAALSVLMGESVAYSKRVYASHELSFSQEGEDGVLRRLFERQAIGFYVDVGAHHPQRFSNTYKFYLQGWRGINIDPLPESKEKFDVLRPRDVNLQFGIADQKGLMTYHLFEEPAFNTFDQAVANTCPSRMLSKQRVPVKRLADVLSEFLSADTSIDFLSVDVEGLDEAVLRSNDWSRWRPRIVLAESVGLRGMEDAVQCPLSLLMQSVGYSLYGKTVHTLFFVDSRYPSISF